MTKNEHLPAEQGGENMKSKNYLPVIALCFSSFSLGVSLTALFVKLFIL